MKDTFYITASVTVLVILVLMTVSAVISVESQKEEMIVVNKWSQDGDYGRRMYLIRVSTPRGERTVVVTKDTYDKAEFGKELDR